MPPFEQANEGVELVLEQVIPALQQAGEMTEPMTRRRGGGRGVGGLPLPGFGPLPGDASLVCGIATMDSRGRVTDQPLIRALGWGPGQRLDIAVNGSTVIVRANGDGLFALTPKRHLRLPAPVRHWCSLVGGARLLLAAAPDHGLLFLHTMATLNAMIIGFHADMQGGEQGGRGHG